MFSNTLTFVVGVGVGIYIAQNYNIPPIKLLLAKAKTIAANMEKTARKNNNES